MEVRDVYWLGKFGGKAVRINAADFDPAVHSDKPWEKAAKSAKGAKGDEAPEAPPAE